MNSFKKYFLVAGTAVCVVVSGFAMSACKDKKQTLPTPENPKVVSDVFSWDAVENADNYTVKINANEVIVPGINYQLTTPEAISKLVAGANTLSVRANGSGKWVTSEFSASVTYNYTPAPTTVKLTAPVITLDEAAKKITWSAVENASGYSLKAGTNEIQLASTVTEYNLASEDAKAYFPIGTKVTVTLIAKGTGNYTDSNASNAVEYTRTATPAEAAAEFIAKVNAIDNPVVETSLDKIKAAKAIYNYIKDNAAVLDIEGVNAKIEELKQRDADYYGILVAKIYADELKEDSDVADFIAAKAAIETADVYYKELLDNTKAATAKSDYDKQNTAYQTITTQLEEAVDDAVEGITSATAAADLTNKDKETLVGYYDAINEKLEALDDLEGYKAYYLEHSAEHKAAITAANNKVDAILAISVETSLSGTSNPIMNADAPSDPGKIYVYAACKNILGNFLEADGSAPVLYVGDDTDGVAGTYNSDAKCYYYEVTFDRPAADTPTEITYKLGADGEEQHLTVKANTGVVWNGGNAANANLIVNGNVSVFGGQGTVYADIYMASSVEVNGSGVVIKAPKLATVENISGISEKALKTKVAKEFVTAQLLGNKGLRNLDLRLIVYNYENDAYSAIHGTSVSKVQWDTMTVEDAKTPLPLGDAGAQITANGDFEIGGALNVEIIEKIVAAFDDSAVTKDNFRDYIRYHVYVDKNGMETGDFYAPVPGNGFIAAPTIRTYVARFCGTTTVNDNITLRIAIALTEDSGYSTTLRESDTLSRQWKSGETVFTVTEEEAYDKINLGDAGTVIGNDGGITIGAAYNDNGLAAQFKDWDGVPVEGVNKDNVHTFFNYIVTVTLNGETKSFTIPCPAGGNISASVMQREIYNLFQNTTDSNYRIGLQLVLNDAGVEICNNILRPSEVREYDWNVQLQLPTDAGCQVNFTRANGGNLEFLRDAKGNGYVFNYGVDCVEVKFTKDEDSFSVYLFDNNGKLECYKSKDKQQGTMLGCGDVVNGYVGFTGFNDWINAGSGTTLDVTEYTASTKVHFSNGFAQEDYVGNAICPAE